MAKAHRIRGIDCSDDAAAGIRKALKERFDEMCALRQDALKWKDPEGIHSMRVASRRLRSALSDFAPYVNKRNLTSILKPIRSIADALGEVRDQDVAILALEKLASQTPPKFSETLQNLIDARKEIRNAARKDLKKELLKGRLKELGSDFDDAIASATPEGKQSSKDNSNAGHSYLQVASAIIHDRLKELEELSSSLYRPLEGKPLHEMRIAAKRLRYAIELFGDCWGSNILSFAKDAARLQSALGKLHDCDIWIESFGKEISGSTNSRKQAEHETFVWLFTHFNELRNIHFEEAFSLWNQWEVQGLSGKLKEALKP
jgi:CHAD domain-containing protein